MSGNDQGIQLADAWFSSREYGNRQSSLSGDQSHRAPDGPYYYIISSQDPGVPNWVDAAGRRRGSMFMRFDGMKEKSFDPARYLTATKVKLTGPATRRGPGPRPSSDLLSCWRSRTPKVSLERGVAKCYLSVGGDLWLSPSSLATTL